MVHAENADMSDVLQKHCIAVGNVDPTYYAVFRPPIVETECTYLSGRRYKKTGCGA